MSELAQAAPELDPHDSAAVSEGGRVAVGNLALVTPELIPPGLNPGEIAVLTAISKGNTAVQVARELSLAKREVAESRASLMAKFDTRSIAVATDQAIRRGIVPIIANRDPDVFNGLTNADHLMIRLYAKGISNHQIAGESGVRVQSIERYHDSLLERIGAWSRPHAIRRAHELGVLF